MNVRGEPAQPRSKATLRRQLMASLLAPIIVMMLVSSAVAYYYAFNFTTIAYDSSLLDSALDIGRQIQLADDRLQLNLPPAALDMLESDKSDRLYYSIYDTDGSFVSGQRGLPPTPDNMAIDKPAYYNGDYQGSPVRIAALKSRLPSLAGHGAITVQVAETMTKRRALATEVLFSMLLPELLLLALVGVLIWFGVERGLRPLEVLQQEISRRSHVDLSPLPEQDAPGEVRALIHSMNDLLARLSEALAARQRFIADAAHQLRTPLAGLRTQTELALRQKDFTDVQHTLEKLSTATGQTTHLVNQLLSLARVEPAVDQAQAWQPINLNELVRDTTVEWVPVALERNIDLGFEDSKNALYIEGDKLLIREMLRNLIDNAVRYTQRGGQITVRVSASDDHVILGVEDNGPGIPVSERERVFERFHRILGSGVDGCGLGLAIVREIVQSHNADIVLDTGSHGSGTLATVTFNRYVLSPSPLPSHSI